MAYLPKPPERWFRTNLKYYKHGGSWAWILHRVTGLGLTAYIYVHIYALTTLTQGERAFDDEMKLFMTPVFKILEWLLFSLVIFHALNGVRIVLVDWANGARYHKKILAVVYGLGIALFIGMGFLMFMAPLKNMIASIK
ncbi:MAG TPA: succinate dehydrogenase, cytochrome b556 subunit [Candidatus Acidoferrales bacterium]|nr:succinate dehydrogenase, cytochrome b556 subunit [Candidatus Acidoferrales bacterium]